MNPEAKQASLIIDSVAKAVANWTVDQHAKANPQLANRFGDTWRADWIDHTLSQVHILAQSVAVRRSSLFASSVRWTCESFRSRDMQKTDLVQNTECLRDVLGQELPPPVGKVAVDHVSAAIEELNLPDTESGMNDSSDGKHNKLVLDYLKAVLESNRAEAESMILSEMTNGIPLPEIYEVILAPAQARLGRMWHRGQITVADEHLGSATTQAVMSQLRPHFQRNASNNRTVVGTSTPGDFHEIGLRMVTDLFEFDGWNVVYLGANTPVTDIIEILERHNADLLALSVSTSLSLRDAAMLIEDLRATRAIAKTNVLVGGTPFAVVPDLWRELGADGYAESAREAVALGNQLVNS